MSLWNRHDDESWVPDAWPADSATVERRLRDELLTEIADSPDMRVSGIDDIRTTVDLDGTEITHLLIDATGVKLKMKPAPGATPRPQPDARPEPDVIARTPGMLRFARITADPVNIQGYDVRIDATLHNVAFDWARYATPVRADRPATAFAIADADDPGTPSGAFSVRMRADDLGPMIESVARPLLKESGVRLRRLDTTVTADAEQNVAVDAVAGVRWKIFFATVRAHAEAHVDSDAILTVKTVRLSSRNPLIALALRLMREELREAEGRRIDLNAEAAADGASRTLRVHDLRVRVAQHIEVTGRIG
ncbi:hypothetical protein B4U78_010780 [Microbacterium esteraromaticum]|uniref:hypothetical protein n=1 Tax=Microbacterium esteraromaticum TaxID=57043 RepID=UPI000C08D97C|nr:hypothetical protein B4U78_010780 [Microbacterium esteraromaticum]